MADQDYPYVGSKFPPPPPNLQGNQNPQGGFGFQIPLPLTLSNLLPNSLLGWGMTIDLDGDMGLAVDPAAAPYGSALTGFWRVHAGIVFKTVTCVATVLGTANPQMPSPFPYSNNVLQNYDQPNNPNYVSSYPFTPDNNPVLLRWKITNFTPQNTADGMQIRGTMAMYLFCYQLGPTLGVDALDLGASPFDVTPEYQNVLNPADFYKYLNLNSPVAAFVAPLSGGGFNGGSPINY